jgi:hypothetical protein
MLDRYTAKFHAICPHCEGYGGGKTPEGHEDSDCLGSCPECWCPGCHDGQDFPESRLLELDDDDPCGSWRAFRLIEAEKEGQRKHRAEARSPQMVIGGAL